MQNFNQDSISNILSPKEMLDMMRHFVRLPKLYRTFKEHIQPSFFNIVPPPGGFSEEALLFIWKALELYYEKQGDIKTPTKEMLTIYVREVIRQGYTPEPGVETLLFGSDVQRGCIDYIFECKDEDINELTGEPLIKAFIYQRSIVPEARALHAIADTDKVKDVTEELQALAEKAARIKGIGLTYNVVDITPDLEVFASLKADPLLTTGSVMIDKLIGGGQRKSECNGISGPNGSGKSTLALNMLVGSARDEWQRTEGKPDLCVYYTYESPASDLAPRIWSDAYNIARDSVAPRGGLVAPSTSVETMKPYEKELFHSMGPRNEFYQSEYERWMDNKTWVNSTIQVRNFSGTADAWDDEATGSLRRALGRGGVSEIVNDLEFLVQERKTGVRVVFIDYAKRCVARQLGESEDSDNYKIYAALASFGMKCLQQIANRFDCTVWVVNQVRGSFGKEGVGKVPNHFDGSDCTTFAENMSNFICLGNPDSGGPDRQQCLWLNASKTRNAGVEENSSRRRIVQFDKYISRLNDVMESYHFVPRLGCFMPNTQFSGMD